MHCADSCADRGGNGSARWRDVALLTIYDMCKAVDKEMQISDVRLVEKTKRAVTEVFESPKLDTRGTLIEPRSQNMQIQVGIITISDRASAGEYEDLGGPALREAAQEGRMASPVGSDCSRRRGTDSTDDSFVFTARLRLNSDNWRHGRRTAGRYARSDSRNHARRVTRFRRSDARESMKITANSILVAQPGSDRRSFARDCPSRESRAAPWNVSGLCKARFPHGVALAQRKPTSC